MRNEKGQFIKGHPIFPNNPFSKGNQLGKKLKGHSPWNKGVKGYKKSIPVSEETKFKISNTLKNKEYIRISKEHDLIRRSAKYKNWRLKVYERDKYTCVECGETKKYLNADHIKSFANYPKLRFVVSNGRTLCIDCHKKTASYGRTKRWEK